ncbi:hypothetical protein LJR022_000142 [Paraburkholderia hospita]|uniref:hypothetical protein n=1 Tax=Paraburkholderia hospita TaxID=169430 RepID=UPI003ECC3385
MTDFADAFNRGQEAAVRAAAARAEVDDVFDKASRQLSEVTQGRLELGRQNFEKAIVRKAAHLFGGLALDELLAPKEQELWVAARNPKAIDSGWVKLAKWERPQEGYPCLLKYDSRDVRCHDQDSLAGAIADLLATAWAGERLRELLVRPTTPDSKDSKKA